MMIHWFSTPHKNTVTVEDILKVIMNLQQNTVRTLDIHGACLSPAKTRQHHAHPLKSKQVVHPLINTITKNSSLFHHPGKKVTCKKTLRETRNILVLTTFTSWASDYPFIIVRFDNSRCFLWTKTNNESR